MITVALLHGRSAWTRALNRRLLTPKRATLALRAAKVLSGQLMRESRVGVVRVVQGLTLLVRKLRACDVLLLILRLILILLWLTVLTLIGIVVEIATWLASSVSCRALRSLVLHLRAQIIIGLLGTLLLLEYWLREC